MPFFSIVIANYNHGQYLDEAIRSVVSQSCRNFELIIVDGGSTDNSPDVIKKHSGSLAWWVSEPDKGQSDAINKGFGRARGEFFLWLNADDLMLPGALEAAKSHLQKNPSCRWLAGNTVYFDESGTIRRCIYGPQCNDWLMKRTMVCNMVNGPSSIFQRAAYEKVKGLDTGLKYAMDMDLWMKFVDMGMRFDRIRRYVWGFRIHGDSKTSHSIGSVQREDFKREVREVILRNNRVRTKTEIFVLRVFKLITGTYFHTLYDSRRWRELPVSRIIEDYSIKLH